MTSSIPWSVIVVLRSAFRRRVLLIDELGYLPMPVENATSLIRVRCPQGPDH